MCPWNFLKKFFFNFQNGIYNALPSLANLIFSVILGYMADKIILKKYLNKEMVTKIWQIIAFGSMIAALGTMGFFTKKIEICLSIIIVGFGLNSAVNSGHLKNVLDLSQSYSGTVYGFSNGFGNISGFLSPKAFFDYDGVQITPLSLIIRLSLSLLIFYTGQYS